jgi:two-component system, NtrC family, sensor kinase
MARSMVEAGGVLGRLGTRTRLLVTFATILVFFGVALLVALRALSQMERAEREQAELDRAKHAGHAVAALVREQYIHQAHTVIEWDRSHIDHYRDIVRITAAATHELAAFARTPEDRAAADEIVRLVRQNDEDFLAVTLPAIDRNEHAEVARLHAATEEVIGHVLRLVRELNGRLEARSDAARALTIRERSRVKWTTLACFGAAALMATMFALATTRSIAHRVSVVRQGAKALGDGDLARRVVLTGRDELSEIAAGLNDMAARLEQHQTELVRSQKLALIGRLCAGVAHEINGPIGVILGYAKVIRRQGADEESLSAIEDEARQCQRIVQALLDTSRHDVVRRDAVELDQLARDGVERLRTMGMLGARRLAVHAGRPVCAYGDEAKLRQVVLNLLVNAVEATDSVGKIVIDVADRDGQAVLTISDDGAGLEPTANEHLFEPFYTTKPSGNGLGLAVSRAIVEAHRGELRVESLAEGGTRAEVRLATCSPEGVT